MSVGARLRGRDYHPEPCAEGTFRDAGKEAWLSSCLCIKGGIKFINDARLEGWLRIELCATTAAGLYSNINRTVCMDCPISFIKRDGLETAENVPSVIRQIQKAAAFA